MQRLLQCLWKFAAWFHWKVLIQFSQKWLQNFFENVYLKNSWVILSDFFRQFSNNSFGCLFGNSETPLVILLMIPPAISFLVFIGETFVNYCCNFFGYFHGNSFGNYISNSFGNLPGDVFRYFFDYFIENFFGNSYWNFIRNCSGKCSANSFANSFDNPFGNCK